VALPLPGTAPALPVTWSDLANRLAARDSTLTAAAAGTIAAACLAAMAAAAAPDTTCDRLSIFVTGSDTPLTTRHDIDAISGHPPWALLSYEPRKGKPGKGWYDSASAPVTCRNRPSTQACDEFPYFATQQGGPRATPVPSLRPLDGADNSAQGGNYGRFVINCELANGEPFIVVALAPELGIPSQTRVC
jgi:hypothetical protein